MSPTELQTPILSGGIRTVNFFNGRLLTARDLSREQEANDEEHRRLGEAIGAGVARGLEVSQSPASMPASPVLTVEPGLAINRRGLVLCVEERTDVSLVRQFGSSASGPIFGACQPLQTGTYVAGAGVYLLTLASAVGKEGRAVTSGLGTENAACNTDTVVQGVQFRLLPLSITAADLNDLPHLRNRLAYRCYGVNDPRVGAYFHDPFAATLEGYGLIDELRGVSLTDCEVPLAVLYWTATKGIEFVDLWSARRRLEPLSAAGQWAPFMSQRRQSEAEAMFLQFEEQLRTIRLTESNLDTIVASQRFDFLPPVGLLPLNGSGGGAGFTYQNFFGGLAYHPPIYLEAAMVEPLVHTCLLYGPINLVNNDPIKLFLIAEGATTRPYIIFTSAYVPFQAEARFDVTRWNFSNFA